jgi:hypothetical protein
MTNTPLRNDSGGAITRTCASCGISFTPHGRRRFCDDACRQAAWRQRHSASVLPPLPRRVPRASVIYECPECEARFVRVQRCDQCQRFCRRVGPCPHCDEPVALADLLPEDRLNLLTTVCTRTAPATLTRSLRPTIPETGRGQASLWTAAAAPDHKLWTTLRGPVDPPPQVAHLPPPTTTAPCLQPGINHNQSKERRLAPTPSRRAGTGEYRQPRQVGHT